MHYTLGRSGSVTSTPSLGHEISPCHQPTSRLADLDQSVESARPFPVVVSKQCYRVDSSVAIISGQKQTPHGLDLAGMYACWY